MKAIEGMVYGGKSLDDLAHEVGLRGLDKRRYVEYIRRRREKSEYFAWDEAYAREWAERFRDNRERQTSDAYGVVVLSEIDALVAEGRL
jgi:hypothetical protein